MSWTLWLGLWAFSLALTGVVVALAFWIGMWTLPIVFGSLIVGGGFVVTRAA